MREKKIFARKLVSIKDLERSEQGASEDIGLSNTVKMFESMVNPFDGLFDSFSPSVLTSFVDISQSSGPPLG